PDTVEVSMRQKDDRKIYFLLNHQSSHVRLHFYKPMHDFLTGQTFTGNYDLPSHGVLVLDETVTKEEAGQPGEAEQASPAAAEEKAADPAAVPACPEASPPSPAPAALVEDQTLAERNRACGMAARESLRRRESANPPREGDWRIGSRCVEG